MNIKDFNKLIRPRETTLSIHSPNVKEIEHSGKTLFIAPGLIRSIAQNFIDHEPDHRHIRGCGVLILVETSNAHAKKIENGKRVYFGKAGMASIMSILLSKQGKAKNHPLTYTILINGNWINHIGLSEDNGRTIFADYESAEHREALLYLMYVIDHELTHCSAAIEGIFTPEDEIDSVKDGLKPAYIETLMDVRNSDDHVLIRFYKTDPDGNYSPCIRKHDSEDFYSMAKRHGKISKQLCTIVDRFNLSEMPLFDKPKQKKATG